ncbi:MAG: dihydroorotase [Chlorobiales bacterium]|nr:dihydroorotase [Chlorobiales bacterium]
MSIIIKNTRLINPAQALDQTGSIKISEQGIIEAVYGASEEVAAGSNDRVIDFAGGIVSAGLFDMHCHFREPGFEYKETLLSGSNAAIAGGFTGVAVMPNTNPPIDNAPLASYISQQSKDIAVDIEVIGALTEGRKGQKISSYGDLHRVGVKALSDDGNALMNTGVMRLAFEYASTFGMLIIQHCEDEGLSGDGVMNEGYYSSLLGLRGIPKVSEPIILSRDLDLLKHLLDIKGTSLPSQPRYHAAHLSTKASIELVREAKKAGLPVTCEVTPHHFTLTDKDLFEANYDGNFVMKPALTTEADRHAILEGIADGTIDAIATDHAPHALHEKDCGLSHAAFGIVGLETSVGLTFTELVGKNRISAYRAIEMLSSAPRKIMSLPPIEISAGKIANLTLIDPNLEWTVDPGAFKSKSKNTPFTNRRLKGKAVGICNKGNIILDHARF